MNTIRAYKRKLAKDVSFVFSGKMFLLALLASFLLFAILGALGWWAVIYANSNEPQNWKEYVFGILGIINGKPEAGAGSVLYSAFVRLLAAIAIGGVLTSFLCALAERFAQMKLRGILVPYMRGHFVVFGFGEISKVLIKSILFPDSCSDGDLALWIPLDGEGTPKKEISKRRVLLVTSHPIETVREGLGEILPPNVAKRVVYAYAEVKNDSSDSSGLFDSLSLSEARQVFIVGDRTDADDGDISNLTLAKRIGAVLATRHSTETPDQPRPSVPIYVRLDGAPSFDFIKKISFLLPGQADSPPKTFFKPFGFYEGWARRVLGGVESFNANIEESWPPLDFAPMTAQSQVHLVVIGLTCMGEAMVIEAIRVCHYPAGRNTRITIVDERREAKEAFYARHLGLVAGLPDIDIEFVCAFPESQQARDLLREAALDNDRLLTVAVCLSPSDRALEVSLSLPEETYWHRLPGKRKTIRERYRENGPRILVLQEHRGGLGESAMFNERFENLRVFGMSERGLNLDCIREFPAMYLNAVYDWPRDVDGSLWIEHVANPNAALSERIRCFREKWNDQLALKNPFGVFEIDADEKYELLRDILIEGGELEIQRFQEYSFKKYLSLKPELRWANVYVSDSWGTVFRSLGLRIVRVRGKPCEERIRNNDTLFVKSRDSGDNSQALFEMEHNRWVADRVLMGYRAPRPGSGEIRDDAFRYHSDIISFDSLSPTEVGKDELSIRCIPLFAALEGYLLVRDTGDGE